MIGVLDDIRRSSHFRRDGEVLVVLLTGTTKQRRPRDIGRGKALWADYERQRKPPAR